MATLDLTQMPRNALELHIWRAKAIEGYANIEFNLSMLFADLLQTPIDYAGVVFFRLTNTHSRNAIFETLLKKRHGDRFDAYWHGVPNTPDRKGLFHLIRRLDQRRNEIVHWHTVNHVHVDEDGQTSYLDLAPPNAWSFKTDRPNMGASELQEFCEMARFTSQSIGMFFAVTSGHLPPDSEGGKTWLEILQKPCTYPPPDSHPLSPNHEAPESPPPPSEG